jgi:hypothetical protein
MAICHTHNLRAEPPSKPRPFGVRVSLRATDPFRRILGPDWNRTHWFESADARDAALAEMSREHEYSRPGDPPALQFEKVEILGVPVQNVRPRNR